LYGGRRWSFWRPPLLSEPGVSFVHRSMRSSGLLFHMLRQKKTLSWGIAFWAFCTGLLCGTLRILLHIGEGPLGGIGNTAPSSSDVIPMGSKRFALQGIEYAFLLLSSYSTLIEANRTAVTGLVSCFSWVVWGSGSGGGDLPGTGFSTIWCLLRTV
jgi:hypothetical protein